MRSSSSAVPESDWAEAAISCADADVWCAKAEICSVAALERSARLVTAPMSCWTEPAPVAIDSTISAICPTRVLMSSTVVPIRANASRDHVLERLAGVAELVVGGHADLLLHVAVGDAVRGGHEAGEAALERAGGQRGD